jgi:hypothetical protein
MRDFSNKNSLIRKGESDLEVLFEKVPQKKSTSKKYLKREKVPQDRLVTPLE